MSKRSTSISNGLLPVVAIAAAIVVLCASAARGAGGSLWLRPASTERSMFADKSARHKGDILTVVVSESSNMSNSLRTDTDKEANILNSVGQWLFSPQASGFGTHRGELPATDISGSNDYSGGGSINNQQALNARASVLVIDVLPNGNLVIEGVRVVTFSGETQFAVLRGFVRPYDITAANTVPSDRIADARVEFISEGSLTEAQRKGWLLRINEKINPF